MPFLVRHLIQGNDDLVTITPDATVQCALDLMIAHDYSQLPVVDSDMRPLGLITGDSILRAISNLGATIDALHVTDALIKAHVYRDDDDLFELLNGLRDDYAVLIADDERRLCGIVTSYDTTAYFRRRAQDMMLVEDIEMVLKELIQAIFSDGHGNVDQEQLGAAIADVADAASELRKQFGKALNHYLSLADKGNGTPSQEWVDLVFTTHLGRKGPSKSLNDLTFGEYTELLLHKSKMEYVKTTFQLDPKAIRTMLNAVRETRNALAHFRGDISPKQRDQLHFCIDWLAQRQKGLIASVDRVIAEAVVSIDRAATRYRGTFAGDGRYDPLMQHLVNQPSDCYTIGLTFAEIESIIGDKLPESAREHQSWWDNSPDTYPAQLWLDAGWRKAQLDMSEERVTFSRLKGFRTLQGA